jgi:hypothetical protein
MADLPAFTARFSSFDRVDARFFAAMHQPPSTRVRTA